MLMMFRYRWIINNEATVHNSPNRIYHHVFISDESLLNGIAMKVCVDQIWSAELATNFKILTLKYRNDREL